MSMPNTLLGAAFAAFFGLVPSIQAAPDRSGYELRTARGTGSVDRVEVALEVGGDLSLSQGGSNVEKVKMRVLANLEYEEKTLETGSSATSIRYYDKAVAAVQVGDNSVRPTIRDDRRLIGVRVRDAQMTLYCPQGPLTRDELDLVDLLGNSLLLDRLLPGQRVRVGQSWKHGAELMALLLGLDKVTEADVSSTLAEVKEGTARIEMQGRIQGTDKGASADVQLRANYRFDMSTGRITWFGLLVQEQRSEGLVEKAFDAVARLQAKISPMPSAAQLTTQKLDHVPLEPAEELFQLEYRSPSGGWQFINDPRWFITGDEQDRIVMLLIDGQQRIAQCHVYSTASAGAPERTTMSDFQEDVQKALGEQFGRFVQASQSANDLDYRVFRIVAEGAADGVPIQWIYYLVADEQGRQATVAFVVEAEQLERFAEADQPLVATLQFGESKMAARDERAKEVAPSPK